MRAVETLINAAHQDDWIPRPVFTPSPLEVDQVSTVLASISPTLDHALIYDSLKDISKIGKFKSSIGSTNSTTSQFLVDDDTEATEPSLSDDYSADSTYILDELFAEATKLNIYLDEIMVSAAHASIPKGICASHLYKIFRINLDSAKRTLEVMSQHIMRNNNPTLYRNFETNNRMMQYLKKRNIY